MKPFLISTNDKMPAPGQAPRSSPNKTTGAAPNLYDHFAEHLQREPHRPSAFERICRWLGRTFDETPRGFAWFAGTLAPLVIAAFCVGYFGVRELLAGVGL